MENLTLKLKLRRHLDLIILYKYNSHIESNAINKHELTLAHIKRKIHFWLANQMAINNGYDIYNFSLSEIKAALSICQEFCLKNKIKTNSDFMLVVTPKKSHLIYTGGYHVASKN